MEYPRSGQSSQPQLAPTIPHNQRLLTQRSRVHGWHRNHRHRKRKSQGKHLFAGCCALRLSQVYYCRISARSTSSLPTLQRLEDGEEPLDFAPMGGVLRGVFELRDRDSEHWYGVFYIPLEGLIYVLHCFTKKNQPNTVERDCNRRKAAPASKARDRETEERGQA
jgi:phage-related protein